MLKHKNLLFISLGLLVLVLIGVSIIEPLANAYPWMQPVVPLIVSTGFFVFLVSVSLFVYVIIQNFSHKK